MSFENSICENGQKIVGFKINYENLFFISRHSQIHCEIFGSLSLQYYLNIEGKSIGEEGIIWDAEINSVG
jgi:hypothetical protein